MQSMYEVVVHKNLDRLLGGGRMPGYYKYCEKLSADEYLQAVIEGEIKDPVITFPDIHRGCICPEECIPVSFLKPSLKACDLYKIITGAGANKAENNILTRNPRWKFLCGALARNGPGPTKSLAAGNAISCCQTVSSTGSRRS